MSVQTSDGASGTVEHYKMPDAGEGLTEAEIVTWRVAVGDTVEVNDIVVEVETAKSLVELPCPYAGVVAELMADVGQTVAVGTPILAVRTGDAPPVGSGDPSGGSGDPSGGSGDPSGDAHPDADRAEPVVGDAAPSDVAGAPVGPSAETASHPSTQAAAGAGRTAVLVGYGPAAGATRRRARRTDATRGPARTPPEPQPVEDTEDPVTVPGAGMPASASGAKVLAKPPVRKLAKDLGVDISQVPANSQGIVDRHAVLWVAEQSRSAAERPADWTISEASDGTLTSSGSTTADRGDRRIPVKGVRKHTADAMVASAFTAPHVTEWVQVDVTESVRLLERLKADRATRELRLSPFTLVARAMCVAARRHPTVNVSWDEAAREIVVHGSVGLGFAAATERGLVVPVVARAEVLDLASLAAQVADLVDTARAGKLQPAQQSGVTLTVTNVGVFGVDGGTPILPPGTGLILACGQVRRMPWVVGSGDEERIVARDVMTLAVSFDHRMIDGELGSRYLADVARLLEEPGYGLVWS